MRIRHCLCVLALTLFVSPVRAQPAPKVVHETWDAVYAAGVKCGYFHARVVEGERDGKKVFITTQEISLKILRDGKVAPLQMEGGCEETADGTVLRLSTTMLLDKVKLTFVGTVEGNKVVVRLPDGKELKRLDWDDTTFGLYAQERMWKEKKIEPGDRLRYTNFDLGLQRAMLVRINVGALEETDILEVNKDDPKAKPERVKRNLLRVESVPDKVEIEGKPLQLPKMVSWLNADRQIVRTETDMPGLGRVVTYRTTKDVATEEGSAPALLPDLLLTTLIPLDKRIDNAHSKASILFRITYTGEGDAQGLFANETHQKIDNVKDNTFEVRTTPRRLSGMVERPLKLPGEYSSSNYFLDSANETVKAHALQAVGAEADPWLKATKIEKWVHDNMKSTTEVVFATASQVAKDLRGDCRQHAMLAAAMCRAAGIPSRTAIGLVYYEDRQKGPVLGFHMWTEVYIREQWLAIDATMGRGGVGAGHLKVSDQSWHDTQTLLPLLPVLRVLGKIKVEVIEAR